MTTRVYLPQQVATDFRRMLGGWDHLAFMQDRLGAVEVHELDDGEELELDDVRIRPFRLAEDYVYGFLFSEEDRRALVVMDELNGWQPPHDMLGVDVAVLPMGICELDPFTGERRIAAEHPILRVEATLPETLDVVRGLGAGRVYLTHVEEIDGLGYDDLRRLERKLAGEGVDVVFAHDGLVIDV